MDGIQIKQENPGPVKGYAPVEKVTGEAESLPAGRPEPRQLKPEIKETSHWKTKIISTDSENMLEVASRVSERLKSAGVKIQLRVNREAGKIIIVVKDPKTDRVIREIPPESYMKSVEIFKQMKKELYSQGIEIDVKY